MVDKIIQKYDERMNNPSVEQAYEKLIESRIEAEKSSEEIYAKPNALGDFKIYSQLPRIQRMLEQ